MSIPSERRWTVGDAAAEVGVTRRTLHHYDDVGLLSPSERSAAGYRLYTADDLARLRTIVLWRRLQMPLEQIRAVLESDVELTEQLRRHREALIARRDDLSELVRAIDRTMEEQMDHPDVTGDQLRDIFGDEFDDGLAESERRWGDSDAWTESQRRTASYGPDDWTQIKAETESVRAAYVTAYTSGRPADSHDAVDAAEAHRRHIDRWFYDCGLDVHRQLAQLYVDDPRYALGHDDVDDPAALAVWISQAIRANADRV